MRKVILVLCLLLAACANPSVGFNADKLKTNEILGAGYDHLDGKIFSIFCGGNGYADYTFVKDSCMYNTSEFVYNNGYEYFSMLAIDGDTNKTQTGYVSNGTYIPYEVTKYTQYYTIMFLTDKEKDKSKNYYKVSDYYQPEQK